MVKLTRVDMLRGQGVHRTHTDVEIDPADVDCIEPGNGWTWICSKRGRGYDIPVNETVERVRELIGGESDE